ncbi:transposase [Micromonospora lutea]|uniref:Tc1-like transposase DDE domain-containing protein n=1 Tax=Micromonospora lutea TaxID=419825 RepID=A0ABQ4INU1_9ACTN|nr:transposase [Micromonospora lutea]GIJ19383.1 hypothetical protein Vlu01_00070 [Micromonospora lutea]
MAGGKTVAAQRDAWICFEDEAGQTLRPPKAHTWGRRGHTPRIPVAGKGSGRVSTAGLACYKPGQRPRLIYRTITHRGCKNERRSFGERDYISLLDAHQQLRGPIVLVWGSLNTHISPAIRQMISARDWLTVIRLPAYAPTSTPPSRSGPTSNAASETSPSAASTRQTGEPQLVTVPAFRRCQIERGAKRNCGLARGNRCR